jgi:hypothetical protein
MDGAGAGGKSCDLPNPVFIAVSANTIYAFKFKPFWFTFKIKKEAARWPKKDVSVTQEKTGAMCYLLLTTASGENYPLEIPTMMGGGALVDVFLDAMGAKPQ